MRRVSLGLVLLTLSFFVACGGGSSQTTTNGPATLQTIQVTAPNANLTVGQTLQLKATGVYSDGSSKDLTSTASWTPSDSTLATISSSGLLTAVASGTVSASAKMGAINGVFSVQIAPALVSIAVTPATATIAASTSQQFVATGTYTDGSTQNLTSSATWSSSNTAVATVGSGPTSGLVKALTAGTTTVKATSGSISGSASLTVTSATATSITVTPAGLAMPLGLTQQFTAIAQFSDGTSQDITGVAAWSSSAKSVATITASGLVSAVNIGSATISATFESVTGSTSLTVNAANLVSITITPANTTIAPGTNVQLRAIGTFNDGGTRDLTHTATWTGSNSAIATVGSGNGFVVGLTTGSITATATLGSVSGSTSVTVSNAHIVSISVTPTSPSIPIGGQVHFKATAVFDDSSTQDLTSTATWNSSNTSVATVGNTGGSFGVAIGVSSGSANITASFSFGGATATGTASLTVSSGTLVSIAISPTSGLVAPGANFGFTATGTFSDGTQQLLLGSVITWSSSDVTVATIGSSGTATGQSPGVVSITATSGSVSASASLVVESSTLTSIQVTPANSGVPVGIQSQFTAIGVFANGDTQNLTSSVTWTSSAPSIATVSNSGGSLGVVTGVQAGTATISAAFGGQVGSASVTVKNVTLTAIAVTPSSPSIILGNSQQFTATGTFSDNSSFNLTFQANWSSSTPTVATIDAHGLASSVTSGTSTIQASLNGVNGTAILTVQ
jgi:uncharacterized protein YjdB